MQLSSDSSRQGGIYGIVSSQLTELDERTKLEERMELEEYSELKDRAELDEKSSSSFEYEVSSPLTRKVSESSSLQAMMSAAANKEMYGNFIKLIPKAADRERVIKLQATAINKSITTIEAHIVHLLIIIAKFS